MDVGRNLVTRDEVKEDVLNSFFASVFRSKTACSLGTQPLELIDRDMEQAMGGHSPLFFTFPFCFTSPFSFRLIKKFFKGLSILRMVKPACSFLLSLLNVSGFV